MATWHKKAEFNMVSYGTFKFFRLKIEEHKILVLTRILLSNLAEVNSSYAYKCNSIL